MRRESPSPRISLPHRPPILSCEIKLKSRLKLPVHSSSLQPFAAFGIHVSIDYVMPGGRGVGDLPQRYQALHVDVKKRNMGWGGEKVKYAVRIYGRALNTSYDCLAVMGFVMSDSPVLKLSLSLDFSVELRAFTAKHTMPAPKDRKIAEILEF